MTPNQTYTNDLDLDALEREPRFDALARDTILALCKRLRAAEELNARLGGKLAQVNDLYEFRDNELRASRRLVALGSTLSNRVLIRANIQGASRVRLLYEEERAAEAFEKALAELDGDHSRD